MAPKNKDDGGSLLNRVLPSDTDYELLANLIFDNAPDNTDGAKARTELRRRCWVIYNRFKVPRWYGPEDHYQDVASRFWKVLPSYRGEAKLGTLVDKIALNQLIDMHRRRWQRETPEAMLRDDENFFDLLEQQLARKQNVNTAAEAADGKIYEKELASNLGQEDYYLFRAHFVFGETKAEIARKSGVTRQAVSKRLSRIEGKVKRINDKGSSKDSELPDFSGVVTR